MSDSAIPKLFISYSKSDKSYLSELKTQLASLKRQNLLETWDDTDLIPGEEWDAAIRKHFQASDIIILLVSADFMATDYIWDVEIKAAIERHERGEATVIPIIIRPCVWSDTPFARLTALPEKAKPVSTWENKDEAWTQVVQKIKTVLQAKATQTPETTPKTEKDQDGQGGKTIVQQADKIYNIGNIDTAHFS